LRKIIKTNNSQYSKRYKFIIAKDQKLIVLSLISLSSFIEV